MGKYFLPGGMLEFSFRMVFSSWYWFFTLVKISYQRNNFVFIVFFLLDQARLLWTWCGTYKPLIFFFKLGEEKPRISTLYKFRNVVYLWKECIFKWRAFLPSWCSRISFIISFLFTHALFLIAQKIFFAFYH